MPLHVPNDLYGPSHDGTVGQTLTSLFFFSREVVVLKSPRSLVVVPLFVFIVIASDQVERRHSRHR